MFPWILALGFWIFTVPLPIVPKLVPVAVVVQADHLLSSSRSKTLRHRRRQKNAAQPPWHQSLEKDHSDQAIGQRRFLPGRPVWRGSAVRSRCARHGQRRRQKK